jgi:HAE1 family hydrophobic/amphiphilic exporter-1
VRSSLANSTVNQPKGTLYGGQHAFSLLTNDQMMTAEGFNEYILAYREGAPIRVRDIGYAVVAAEDRTLAGWSGTQRAVLIQIQRQPGANVIETVDGIKKALPQLEASLPPSIKVDIVSDQTQTIRASVADVQFTLLLTIALVVGVIFLFLRKLWATAIPAIAVPLSLIGTFAVMYVLGFSLDNLSLMALTIAIGFVVDDAIVMIENIVRHIEDGATPMTAAIKGAGEIGFTILSISISLIAVFIPLFLMSGVIGLLFREFAITVAVSIVVSLILMDRQRAVLDVVIKDPAVASATAYIGPGGSTVTENNGRVFITLKPHAERNATADQVIIRLNRALQPIQGIRLYMQSAQDINVGARLSKTQYQYTLHNAGRFCAGGPSRTRAQQ